MEITASPERPFIIYRIKLYMQARTSILCVHMMNIIKQNFLKNDLQSIRNSLNFSQPSITYINAFTMIKINKVYA